jgi:hypothetical protein
MVLICCQKSNTLKYFAHSFGRPTFVPRVFVRKNGWMPLYGPPERSNYRFCWCILWTGVGRNWRVCTNKGCWCRIAPRCRRIDRQNDRALGCYSMAKVILCIWALAFIGVSVNAWKAHLRGDNYEVNALCRAFFSYTWLAVAGIIRLAVAVTGFALVAMVVIGQITWLTNKLPHNNFILMPVLWLYFCSLPVLLCLVALGYDKVRTLLKTRVANKPRD